MVQISTSLGFPDGLSGACQATKNDVPAKDQNVISMPSGTIYLYDNYIENRIYFY